MVGRTIPRAVRRYTGSGLPKVPALLTQRAPGSGCSRLALPSRCTQSEENACDLAKSVPLLNDLLYFASAEVREVALGILAIRSYPNCGPNLPEEDEECRHYASVLLHYMLAQHRCVVVAELRLSARQNRRFMVLLSDALKSANTSLTVLHLCKSDLNAEATSNAFIAISRLLRLHLVELLLEKVLLDVPSRASLDTLAEGLSNTESLKVLTITEVDATSKESDISKSGAPYRRRYQKHFAAHTVDFPGAVMRALASNTSLYRLVVDASFCRHRYGTTFRRMLANPGAPAELTVTGRHHSHRRKANLVFDALVTNGTVKTFVIEGFYLDRKDARSFSKLLAMNSTIKVVDVAENMWTMRRRLGQPVHPERMSEHAVYLARGLRMTKSLWRLVLNYAFSAREMHFILLAARECATLEEVHFPRLGIMQVVPLHDALQRVGPAPMHKVSFGKFRVHNNKASAQMLFAASRQLRNYPGVPVFHLFTSLRSPCRPKCPYGGDHLSSLELMPWATHVNPAIAPALRAYLPLTRSLRRLRISYPASPGDTHLIIEGITLNDSIEELSLNCLFVDVEAVKMLCGWVARSRRLHTLEMRLGNEGHQLVLQELGRVLRCSYMLTSIVVYQRPDHELGFNAISLARRNFTLVQCAAAFAVGSTLKRAATAFELVSWHPQLPATIQRMRSLSERDAALRIRQSHRRLHDDFWQLAGIVKTSLVCNRPEGGDGAPRRPQLDTLGTYVLEHIRSFLKVGDVLDDEDGPRPSGSVAGCEARPPMRRRCPKKR